MDSKQIFAGVKVLDFTWSIAGPLSTRELAVHGATVIRVESHRFPCPMRRAGATRTGSASMDKSPVFANFNTNKMGLSLNLAKPKAQAVARQLIAWADIVGESFGPGVIRKFGLDYDMAKKIKPDIIYFSTSLQGQYGPNSKYQAWGWQAAALAGFYETVGWPDRMPVGMPGAYTDQIAPYYTVCALAAALEHRRRTGEGMYIDQAQFEVGVTFAEPSLLDYRVNDRITRRRGNRDPQAAPHGIYTCRGEGRWCAIAVFTEDEWRSFCDVIGSPAWAMDEKFATLAGRKENEDELDRLVEQWTRQHDPHEVMMSMQAKGVAAGVAQNNEDLWGDLQLRHRQAFKWIAHPEIGPMPHQKPAYQLSETPCDLQHSGPMLGQDNEHILHDILGLSYDEIADMLVSGAITTDADLPHR